VFSETLGGKWNGGETDSGEIIVEYSAKLDNNDLKIQFTVENENIFKVSSIKGVNIQTDTAEDIANVIQSRYVQYYSLKNPGKPADDLMPKEPITNLLKGISSAYAEKAKSPIDIANYINKSEEEIKTSLSLEEKERELKNSEVSIVYDSKNQKIDTVLLNNSRFYSLFGIQTIQSIDEAKNGISDRFEYVKEKENEDGTKEFSFIRNGSEDSLVIKYDTHINYIITIKYTSNGLEGYRAEQEKKTKIK